MCAMCWPLLSLEPRPYITPSLTTAANGSLCHKIKWFSRLHIVMTVDQHSGAAGAGAQPFGVNDRMSAGLHDARVHANRAQVIA